MPVSVHTQARFDKLVKAFGLIENNGYGPKRAALEVGLTENTVAKAWRTYNTDKAGWIEKQKYYLGQIVGEVTATPPALQEVKAQINQVLGEDKRWLSDIGRIVRDDGRVLQLEAVPQRVLCFSCSQAPFQHRQTIPFLAMLCAELKPDLVVMMGDLVDFKFMKPAYMGPDDRSPTQEIQDARAFIEALARFIPNAVMLTSNHGEGRVAHAQQKGNLPSVFMKRWQDVLGVPNTWITRDYLLAESILWEHGDGVSKGSRASIHEEMIRRFNKPLSVIRGHRHGLFGEVSAPNWVNRVQQSRIVYVGCTMAAEEASYTKSGLWNGAVLIDGKRPRIYPMERGLDDVWTGRIVEATM